MPVLSIPLNDILCYLNAAMENRPIKKAVTDSRKQPLVADREALERIFHRPESDHSRLVLTKYMDQILFGLHDFSEHVGITEEISLKSLPRGSHRRILRRLP
jgi:hypothetical protein